MAIYVKRDRAHWIVIVNGEKYYKHNLKSVCDAIARVKKHDEWLNINRSFLIKVGTGA